MECVYSPGTLGGIGYEILFKALCEKKLEAKKITVFGSQEEWVKTTGLYKDVPKPDVNLLDRTEPLPVQFESTRACGYFLAALNYVSEDPQNRALVTGPMAKRDLPQNKATQQTWGHTEVLGWFFETHTTMMFCSEKIFLIPLTRHIPLSEVPRVLNADLIDLTLKDLAKSDTFFGKPVERIKIAFCGLNPHAGEAGLIGTEEMDWMAPYANALRDRDYAITGPLSADTLMTPNNLGKFDIILSCYHDQLLPAFKALFGNHSSQCTLGIPIVRTSVDHGTGEDIYLQNKACPGSLVYSFKLASQLLAHKGSYENRP